MQLLLAVVDRAAQAVHGTIILACDGYSALERIREAKWAAKGSHLDLVSAILACRQKLESKGEEINLEHVKGHQDRIGGHALSLFEELNVYVDGQAQQFNGECRAEGMVPRDGDIFGEVGPLWINLPHQGRRVKVTQDIVHTTHDLFHAASLQSYLEEKRINQAPAAVDWELVQKANLMRSVGQHMFTVKTVSGYLGVAKWMYRWNQAPSQGCSLCGAELEDISHVYRCRDPRIQGFWSNARDTLTQWVEDSTQSTRLAQFLRQLLGAYRETGPPSIPEDIDPALGQIWMDQLDIGENSMLNGFLSKRWRELVAGSTTVVGASTWLARLICKLYEFVGALWGNRNTLMSTAEGSRSHLVRQAVNLEIDRGPEANPRLGNLFHDESRPGPTSSLEYNKMWLTSVQVARAVGLPQDERDRQGRRIMYQWLRGGYSSRNRHTSLE